MYEAKDYHEDFYILNNVSFGLASDLNDVINTFIVLLYQNDLMSAHSLISAPPKSKIIKISTPF